MGSAASSTRQSIGELPGGEAFFEAFEVEVSKAVESDGSVSIALVDVDEFGRVNEEHGRDVGDEVLRMVVDHLAQIDLAGKSLFRHNFRSGGDEFIVVLPGVEKEEAFLALEHARSTFSGEHEVAFEGKKRVIPLTFSAAVATYPEDGTRPQDVLRKANDALYRAKSGGRNRVCLAKEERMVTKTSHYTQAQLARLSQLAKREEVGEAVLLREALDELLRKYGV